MLNLTWIKNPDHVSYCKENEVLPRLARELGIADLANKVYHVWRNNTPNRSRGVRITVSTSCFVPKSHTPFQWEGVNLKGKKRTTLKLFIPNLTFPEPVEMGENVWIYMGELCPAYCLFTPWEETKEN